MTTSVFSQDKGLKLLLPTGSVRVRNSLSVLVAADGRVLVGKEEEPVMMRELGALVSEKLKEHPKLSIALKVGDLATIGEHHEVINVGAGPNFTNFQATVSFFDRLRLRGENYRSTAGLGYHL